LYFILKIQENALAARQKKLQVSTDAQYLWSFLEKIGAVVTHPLIGKEREKVETLNFEQVIKKPAKNRKFYNKAPTKTKQINQLHVHILFKRLHCTEIHCEALKTHQNLSIIT